MCSRHFNRPVKRSRLFSYAHLVLLALVLLTAGCSGQPAAGQAGAEGGSGLFSQGPEWFEESVRWLSLAMEIAGVACIVIGAAAATVQFFRHLKQEDFNFLYNQYRRHIGRGIILGLEFLVAADILGTVAVGPDLGNLAILAAIVIIRTFLSFAIEVEITGHWPWEQKNSEA